MKSNLLILAAFFLLLITSCSIGIVEKRKHLSGFHWRGGGSPKPMDRTSNDKKKENKITVLLSDSIHNLNQNRLEIEESKDTLMSIIPSHILDSNTIPKTNLSVSITIKKEDKLPLTPIKTIPTKIQQNQNNNLLTYSLLGVLSLAGFLGSIKFLKSSKARNIGEWAQYHPKKTKGIIAGLTVGLVGTSYLMGGIIQDIGLNIPSKTNFALSVLGAGALAFYPIRKVKSGIFKPTYLKQKLNDAALILSGAGLILNLGFQDAKINQNKASTTISNYFSSDNKINETEKNESIDLDETTLKTEKVITKKQYQFFTILFPLCILFTCALVILLLALSCSFSCSGEMLLAYLCIAGAILSVLSCVFACIMLGREIHKYHKIKNKPKRKNTNQ